MKLQRILAGVLLLFCFSVSKAETSQNLIDPQAWDGATYGTDPGGCCASVSGSGALYDNNTDTIMFSYGRDILAQTIAINQALKLSGIEVDGFNYGWTWRKLSNNGSGNDTLQFEVTVKDAAGNEVERYVYDYGSSLHAMDVWHTESGTETFKQSYLDPQSIALSIIGKDGGFWGGYYGPEVKDVSLTLNYRANPCGTNPLFDPSCPGYAEAYAKMLYDQNCAANPLYDSGCPGYAAAYFNQQCTADALYSSACPGYAQAFYNQQCTLDPFYDIQCPGYAQAVIATYVNTDTDEEEAVATVTEEAAMVYVDPIASLTTVSSTGDAVVDSVISAPVTVVSLTEQVTSNEPESESISDSSADVEEQMGDGGGEDSAGSEAGSDEKEDNATGGDSKSKSSSDSRRDKMKKAMTEKAMALADDMSKAATVEAQKAVQAQVLAVMSYVPGFGSYGGTIGGGSYSDAQMYAPTTVPESKRGLRNGLAQQLLHTKIVDSQYKESD
jgi:hypothetical protein